MSDEEARTTTWKDVAADLHARLPKWLRVYAAVVGAILLLSLLRSVIYLARGWYGWAAFYGLPPLMLVAFFAVIVRIRTRTPPADTEQHGRD